VAMVFLNLIFYRLLKAPTRQGRDLMDQIEGLILFLKSGFQNQGLKPEMSQLDRYLPYAQALGVEKLWIQKFEDQLSSALSGSAGGYRPRWYQGAFLNAGALSSFTGAIHSSVVSSTAPASSRGRSGGSGGSSGGGGGGGW